QKKYPSMRCIPVTNDYRAIVVHSGEVHAPAAQEPVIRTEKSAVIYEVLILGVYFCDLHYLERADACYLDISKLIFSFRKGLIEEPGSHGEMAVAYPIPGTNHCNCFLSRHKFLSVLTDIIPCHP